MAGPGEILQLILDLADSVEDPAPVGLELSLARTAGTDASAETAELGALAAQPRQPITMLRQLHLQHAFPAGGVLGEDVEDQRSAVDDVDVELLVEVALLSWRKLVVEDHDVDVQCGDIACDLRRFALADVHGGVWRISFDEHRVDRLRAGRVCEAFELQQARFGVGYGLALGHDTDEKRLLPLDLEVGDGCGKTTPLPPAPGFLSHKPDGTGPRNERDHRATVCRANCNGIPSQSVPQRRSLLSKPANRIGSQSRFDEWMNVHS